MDITEFRKSYPQYDDVDDETLATKLHEKYYSHVDQGEFFGKFGVKPEGSFTESVKRGTKRTLNLIGGMAPLIEAGVGKAIPGEDIFEQSSERRFQEYLQTEEQIRKDHPRAVPSIADVKDMDDFMTYAKEASGEAIPSLAFTLMSGGIGGAMTKVAGRSALTGITPGALAGGFLQNTPESYINLRIEGVDAPYSSLFIGAAKSGLDALPAARILKSTLGKETAEKVYDSILHKYLNEAFKGGVRGFWQEGMTEAAQEHVDQIAEKFMLENKELFTKENFINLVDAGLSGGFAGGPIGAAGGAVGAYRSGQVTPNVVAPVGRDEIVGEVVEEAVEPTNSPQKRLEQALSNIAEAQLVAQETVTEENKTIGIDRLQSVAYGANADPIQQMMATSRKTHQAALQALQNNLKTLHNRTKRKYTKSELVQMAQLEGIKDRDIFKEGQIPYDKETLTSNILKARQINLIDTIDTFKAIERAPKVLNKSLYQVRGQKPPRKTPYRKTRLGNEFMKLRVQDEVEGTMKKEDWVNFLKEDPVNKAPIVSKFKESFAGINEISKKSVMEFLNQYGETLPFPEDSPESMRKMGYKLLKIRPQKGKIPMEGRKKTPKITPNYDKVNESVQGDNPTALDKETIDKMIPSTETKVEAKTTELQTILRQAERESKGGNKNRVTSVLDKVFPKITSIDFNPIRFVNRVNLLQTAINLKTSRDVQDNVDSLMEVFEFIYSKDTGFYTDKSRHKFSKSLPGIVDALENYYGMPATDLANNAPYLLQTGFVKFVEDTMKGVPSNELPKDARNEYRRAYNLIQRTSNALQSAKIKSINDIFTEFDEKALNKARNEIRNARLDREGERQWDNRIVEDAQDLETEVKRLRDGTDDRNQFTKTGAWFRHLVTPQFMASRVPSVAPLVALGRRVYSDTQGFMQQVSEDVNVVREKRPEQFLEIFNKIDYLRKSGQERDFTEDGWLRYRREDGKIVRVNPQTSFGKDFKTILGAFDRYLNALEDVSRKILPLYGLDPKATIPQIEENIKEAKDILEDEEFSKNLDSAEAKDLHNRIEKLKKVIRVIRSVQENKNTFYVPHHRYGDRAVTVLDRTDIDPATGKGRLVAFFTMEEDNLGNIDKFQMGDTKKRLEKYRDQNRYEIIGKNSPMRISYDDYTDFARQLKGMGVSKEMMTLEFMQSVLGTGVDKNYNKFWEMIRQENKLTDKVQAELSLSQIDRALRPSRNIEGNSTDWFRVWDSFVVSSAQTLSRLNNEQDIADMYWRVQDDFNTGKDTPQIHKWKKDYYQYTFSNMQDMPFLRALNFSLTMGFNISTAVLQLFNGPMSVTPATMQWTGNPITANASWANKLRKAGKYLIVPNTDRISVGHVSLNNPEFYQDAVEKGKMPIAVRDAMMKLSRLGILDALYTLEHLGSFAFETRTKKGRYKHKLKKISSVSGMGISLGEQASRMASVWHIMDTLMNKDGSINQKMVERAIETLKDRDQAGFDAFLDRYSDLSIPEAITMYTLVKTHGDFTKAGRGTLNKGLMGTVFTPFMIHPMTQMELMVNLLKGKSKRQKLAGVYLLSTYVAMAGLMGLPAAELWKELYELIHKHLFGTEVDVIHELQRYMVEDLKLDNNFARAMTRGFPLAYSDPWSESRVDFSTRINLPFGFQNLAVGLLRIMNGDDAAAMDIFGPSIGMIGNVADFAETRNVGTMMPVAMKNAYKGLIDYGLLEDITGIPGSQKGARTLRGTQLVSPDEFSKMDKIIKTIGFRPGKEADRMDMKYAERLVDTFFRPEYDKIRREIADLYLQRYRAKERGDREDAEVLTGEIKTQFANLYAFLRRNRVPLDKSRRTAIQNSIYERYMQLRNPKLTPRQGKMSKRQKSTLEKTFLIDEDDE